MDNIVDQVMPISDDLLPSDYEPPSICTKPYSFAKIFDTLQSVLSVLSSFDDLRESSIVGNGCVKTSNC